MKFSRKTRWIALVLVIAAIGLWRALAPAEPRYQGKSFSQWFDEIPVSNWDTHKDAACLAIKAMGKDAVPLVIAKIHGKNSAIHLRVIQWLDWIPGFKDTFDETPWCRSCACLDYLRLDAAEAVPELMEVASGADWIRSAATVNILGRIRARPDLCIPFLMRMATNQNATIRIHAVISLTEFGADAKPAVPVLVEAWQKNSAPILQRVLADWLKLYDPDAAAKAGIK